MLRDHKLLFITYVTLVKYVVVSDRFALTCLVIELLPRDTSVTDVIRKGLKI